MAITLRCEKKLGDSKEVENEKLENEKQVHAGKNFVSQKTSLNCPTFAISIKIKEG